MKEETKKVPVAEPILNNEDEVVRRELPRYSGVYREGHIEDVEVVFTVDTGATTTIVSPRVYHKIAGTRCPDLRQGPAKKHLVSADGIPLEFFGSAWL